jgi:hypothetical protein
MAIPYGTKYTTTVSGAVLKFVNCEQCQAEYVYQMERLGMGEGTSVLWLNREAVKQQSFEAAEASLAERLEKEIDPVPCPACGWYQADMQRELKGEYAIWWDVVGGLLLFASFVAVIVLFVNYVSVYGPNRTALLVGWTMLLGGIVLGAACFIVRRILVARYEPNGSSADDRRRIASTKAVLRAEFDKLAADANDRAELSHG